nr:nonstructural polyprotein [Hepelivirales sp.]
MTQYQSFNPLHTTMYNVQVDSCAHQPTTNFLQNIAFTELQKATRDVTQVNFRMSKEETEIFTEIMGQRPFQYVHTPRYNSHSIAANLQCIAYQKVKNFSNNFKDKNGQRTPAMDIGGNSLRTQKDDHICTLINGPREESRYTISNLYTDNKAMQLLNTPLSHTMCKYGAQNCNRTFRYAYMINVYDIDPHTIVEIFENHQLEVLDYWLFMPLCLLEPGLTTDQKFYNVKLVSESNSQRLHSKYADSDLYPDDLRQSQPTSLLLDGETKEGRLQALFSFNDLSNSYIHDYYKWRSWFHTTSIKTPQATLSIEIVENIGQFYNFRFVKTRNHLTSIIPRVIPLAKIMIDHCIVPNVVKFIDDKAWADNTNDIGLTTRNYLPDMSYDRFTRNCYRLCADLDETKNEKIKNSLVYKYCFIVEKNIVEKLITFATGLKKDAFTYETVKSYASSLQNSLFYERNSNIIAVHKSTNMPVNIFDELVISLFVIAASKRNTRTQVISKAFKLFDPGMFQSLKMHFTRFCQNRFTPNGMANVMAEDQYFNGFISTLKPIYFEDYIFKDTVVLHDAYLTPPMRPYLATTMKESNLFINDTINNSSIELNNSIKLNESSKTVSKILNNTSKLDVSTSTNIEPKSSSSRSQTINSISSIGSNSSWETYQSSTASIVSGKPLTKADLQYELNSHNLSMLISVPGDGYCAIHSINHFLLTFNMPIINIDKNTQQWLNADDINKILTDYKISWTMHESLIPTQQYRNIVDDVKHHICLDLTKQHWSPIKCQCLRHTAIRPSFITMTAEHYDHIGTYKQCFNNINQLYVNNKPAYVNCANHRLTDGKGQALDFNNIFNGYKNHIQLPIQDFMHLQHTMNNVVYELYLAVAHHNEPDNPQLVHSKYHHIFSQMESHAIANNLTIILPLIGTALFKCDIRCLKTHISNLRCKYILTFIDRKQMEVYNGYRNCNHGGYIPIDTGTTLTNTSLRITDDYDYIIFNNPRTNMLDKLNDLRQAIVDSISWHDKQVTNKTRLKMFEISGAPGHFAKHPDIYAAYYNKGIPWQHNENIFDYADIEEFAVKLEYYVLEHGEFDVILSDIGIDINNYEMAIKLVVVAMNYLIKHQNSRLAIKFVLQDNAADNEKILTKINCAFANIDTLLAIVRSHSTKHDSSEIYILIAPFITKRGKAISEKNNKPIDVVQAYNKIDKIVIQEQNKTCKCQLVFDANAKLSVNVSSDKIQQLLNLLYNDNQLRDETKAVLRQIKIQDVQLDLQANIGVGGAGKTTEITNSTCHRCTILISPYNKNMQSLNALKKCSSYCNTYVVALNNLTKYKSTNRRNIIIDEAYVHNYAMVAIYKILAPHATFYATGDNKQITAVDWDGTLVQPTTTFMKPYNTTTKRNPQAIVDLYKTYIPGVITTSKCDNKVKYEPNLDKIIDAKPDPQYFTNAIICFTQKVAQDLKNSVNSKMPIFTAAQAHGTTIECVHLYLTDIKNLSQENRATHLYTAVRRTSRQLIVYGVDGPDSITATLEGSQLMEALEQFEVKVVESTVIHQPDIHNTIVDDTTIRIKPPEVDKQRVFDILDKVYKQVNDLNPNIIDYKLNVLPEINRDAKFRVDMTALLSTNKTISINGKRIASKTYNRMYANQDRAKAVTTQLGRYASTAAPSNVPGEIDKLMFKGFEKWLRPNYKSILQKLKPTPELIWQYAIDGLKKLQSKYPKAFQQAFEEDDINDILHPSFTDEVNRAILRRSELLNIGNLDQQQTDELKVLNKKIKLAESITNDLPKARDVPVDVDWSDFGFSKQQDNNSDNNLYDAPSINDDELVNTKTDDYSLKLYKSRIRVRGIVRQFLQSLTSNESNPNKYKDLENNFNTEFNYHRQINFFMKNQPKEIRKDGFDIKNKHGQGVSAWSKMVNVILSGYVRYFSAIVPRILRDNVHLAYGYSDKDISALFSKYSREIGDRRYHKFCNDFGEFDASQEQKGLHVLIAFYEMGWFSLPAYKLMFTQRQSWKMSLIVDNQTITSHSFLTGNFMQASGQPDTLGSNTYYDMAAVGMCIDIDFVAAFFKGDDSYIIARRWKYAVFKGRKVVDIMGYQFKIDTPEIGEFIANIVTPIGFVPDYLRRVSRVVSKIYETNSDWNEIRLSTADALSVVQQNNLHLSFKYAELFYQQPSVGLCISAEEIETLHWFLLKVVKDETAPELCENLMFVNAMERDKIQEIWVAKPNPNVRTPNI